MTRIILFKNQKKKFFHYNNVINQEISYSNGVYTIHRINEHQNDVTSGIRFGQLGEQSTLPTNGHFSFLFI